MKSSNSRIPDFICSTLVVALAVTLVGSAPALADETGPQLRAQAEMNRGRDYSAAWAAASRASAPGHSETLIAWATKAAGALNAGVDYQAAWEASSSSTGAGSPPVQLAGAQRLEAELNEGKDYVAAREAVHETRPSPARRPYRAPVKAAGRDGVSTIE